MGDIEQCMVTYVVGYIEHDLCSTNKKHVEQYVVTFWAGHGYATNKYL